ncbi:hypothetical protein J8273_4610 [Carpediemonas membranifera]|uniref:Uncharacterized protein n=1 Tax=Carpediemonas membranifera TaxID=201153 RepID=A0A8J6AW68_9EUKA|nr:hypothetical protein J8273_4610 [Carpediemonas membranifera]|eukprot:KAG9394010.1 hypothetical protein J8273_4610 [Carpediemonas membranifera]
MIAFDAAVIVFIAFLITLNVAFLFAAIESLGFTKIVAFVQRQLDKDVAFMHKNPDYRYLYTPSDVYKRVVADLVPSIKICRSDMPQHVAGTAKQKTA